MKKKERTKCEIYSRVVGYFRPVSQWNKGKQAEFDNRQVFDILKITNLRKSNQMSSH